MMPEETYEVEWCDHKGEWRSVKTGLSDEAEAQQYIRQYKGWRIRILKCVRSVVYPPPGGAGPAEAAPRKGRAKMMEAV